MAALCKISAFGFGKTHMLSTCCLYFSSLFPTWFYSTMVSDILLPCESLSSGKILYCGCWNDPREESVEVYEIADERRSK